MRVNPFVLQNQITRLSKIYHSRPINQANLDWHDRVLDIQAEVMRLLYEKKV